jgi:hypothetical protein
MNEKIMVSRSAFAKVQNENHRLKRILKVLCTGESVAAIQLRIEYREMLAREEEMWDIIKELFSQARTIKTRSARELLAVPDSDTDPSTQRTPDLCCGIYPLPEVKPDVTECPHEHWGCPYHACLSDDCQRAVVMGQGHDLGSAMCDELRN